MSFRRNLPLPRAWSLPLAAVVAIAGLPALDASAHSHSAGARAAARACPSASRRSKAKKGLHQLHQHVSRCHASHKPVTHGHATRHPSVHGAGASHGAAPSAAPIVEATPQFSPTPQASAPPVEPGSVPGGPTPEPPPATSAEPNEIDPPTPTPSELSSEALSGGEPSVEQPALSKEAALSEVTPATETVSESAGFRFFSPTSFWNQPLAANAPLDPESASLVSELRALVGTEISGKWGPWISTTGFSTPIYTVPAGQPTTYVHEENGKPSPSLQYAWDAVPLPLNAKPAAGTDEQLTVWQPSTDKLWEFWGMTHRTEGWYAKWGGAMDKVSESPGYFTPSSWSDAQSNWGATATSLPLVGGLITLQNLKEGKIEHALSMSLPAVRKGIWSWPAQRSDGTSLNPESIPEGTRFRLEPSLDVASLNLPPLVRMMALAAQQYGIVVHDKSGVVNFYGQDPAPTGTNPWIGEFGKSFIWQLLAKFPWSHLKALELDVCPGSTCLTG